MRTAFERVLCTAGRPSRGALCGESGRLVLWLMTRMRCVTLCKPLHDTLALALAPQIPHVNMNGSHARLTRWA